MSESKTTYRTDQADPSLFSDTLSSPASTALVIDRFSGEWDFLSNFYPAPVELDGITYPTTEHAFQAMKTRETAERYAVRDAPTPATAKRRGKTVTLREGWNETRFEVMERVLREKFADPVLRDKLMATGSRELIEGNTWRDTTWGAVRDAKTGAWRGRNELGKLLMKLRDELRGGTGDATRSDEANAEKSGTIEVLGDKGDDALVARAVAARAYAYAPYSHYAVGAAVRTATGDLFAGANIENASYGLSNCAERSAVFAAASAGARVIVAVAVVTADGGSPCGACRQVLSEFAPRDGTLSVLLVNGVGEIVRRTTIAELLPLAFDLKH